MLATRPGRDHDSILRKIMAGLIAEGLRVNLVILSGKELSLPAILAHTITLQIAQMPAG
jgi:hypothetical protein